MNDLFNKCSNNIDRFNSSIVAEGQSIIDDMSREMIEQSERGYKKVCCHIPSVHPTLIKNVCSYFRLGGFKCEYKKDHFLLTLKNMK